jgi:hypothetical protein
MTLRRLRPRDNGSRQHPPSMTTARHQPAIGLLIKMPERVIRPTTPGQISLLNGRRTSLRKRPSPAGPNLQSRLQREGPFGMTRSSLAQQ